jgi:hypothetical protein
MLCRHVVIWKFRDDLADSEATFLEMKNRLEALVGVIPGLTSLEVGRDLGDSEANADVVLISEHESAQALEAYQAHPAHLEVAAWARTQVNSRSAVDYLWTVRE